MKMTKFLSVAAVAAGLFLGNVVSAVAHGPGMGPGWGGGYGMGPGMMMQPLRQDLSTGDVKHMMEHRLEWQGNKNLKLGKVTEKDQDTIGVELTDQDGKVVQRLDVNRHTGWMRPAQ